MKGAPVCERCGAGDLPVTGGFIGFFGYAPSYPKWCRACVAAHGSPALLVEFDERVAAEARRQRRRGGDG